jgi:WXG100 family type VII secretion target
VTGGVPGGSGYQVTVTDVADAAGYVDGKAATIEEQVSALRTYVQGLGEYWQGPAHQAFETLMGDYDSYARMLHQALSGIAAGLRGNAAAYADAEDTGMRNIAQVDLPAPNF